MHFVIIGSGAVGGYFGARLAQHGNQVTFVARGEHLNAIIKNGLTVNSINGDFHLSKPNVTENTCGIQQADVILLAVKSFQLSHTIELIKPVLSENTRIIPLLNGVNSAQRLVELGISAENIYGGLAKIISKISSPGVINHSGAQPHITIGALNNENIKDELARLKEITSVMNLAHISCGLSNNIELALWRKFIFVAAWGALASLNNKPVGELRKEVTTKGSLTTIINEYGLIANAEQVNITQQHIEQTLKFIHALPEHSKTSMQRDIASGTLSEFDVLIETPYQLSLKHQLNTPVLDDCYHQLSS